MLILCMINISFKAGIWADGLIQDFSVSGKAIFYSTCQTFMDGAVHFFPVQEPAGNDGFL